MRNRLRTLNQADTTRVMLIMISVWAFALTTVFNACSKAEFSTGGIDPGPTPCGASSCTLDVDLHSTNFDLPLASDRVDLLFVFDISGSMSTDTQKLKPALAGLIDKLDNHNSSDNDNWQMCYTTSDVVGWETGDLNNNGLPDYKDYCNTYEKDDSQTPLENENATCISKIQSYISLNTLGGQAFDWRGGLNNTILSKSNSSRQSIFNSTIDSITTLKGTGVEEPINAIGLAVDSNPSCFRSDAALAAIVITDEDELSCGGRCQNDPIAENKRQFRALEYWNQPQYAVGQVKTKYPNKPFTVHSFSVQTQSCYNSQANPNSSEFHYPFFGTLIGQLSRLTNGLVGNICEGSYTNQMSTIADKVLGSLSAGTLACAPVRPPVATFEDGTRFVYPACSGALTTSCYQAAQIYFGSEQNNHLSVSVDYYCPRPAVPVSP